MLAARVEKFARYVVIVLALVVGIQGIVNLHGLYADGAYALWFNLTTGQFLLLDPARVFAAFLMQVPIMVGLAVGVTDPAVLAVLVSAGPIGLPIAAWIGAMLLVFRRPAFWAMVAMFATVYLNAGFMAVGEYNVAYALAALSAALIVQRRLRWPHLVALLVVAIVLARSYEGVAYLAPLLALGLAYRVFGRDHGFDPLNRRQVVVGAVTLLTYIVGAVLSGLSILYPRDLGNRAGAADLITPLSLDGQLVTSFLVACGVMALAVLPRVARMMGGILLALAVIVFLANPANWAAPELHYLARTVTGLLFAVLLVLFLAMNLVWGRTADSPGAAHRTAGPAPAAIWGVALLLLAVQVIPFSAHSSSFARWLAVVEATVLEATGPVRVEESALDDSATLLYMWPWTNPYLSRLFQDDPGGGMLLSPGQSDDVEQPGPIPQRFMRIGDSILRS